MALLSNEIIQSKKITENVYLLKQNFSYTANILLYELQNSIVLFDTGFSSPAVFLQDKISQITDKPVSYIVNSHIHTDHMGANKLLGKNANIVFHKNGQHKLAYGKSLLCFESELTINLPDATIICMAMQGGHSQYDIICYLRQEKILYMGDIYLSESFPLVGVSQGNSASRLLDIFRNVYKNYDNEVLFIPGHGELKAKFELKKYLQMMEETIIIVRNEIEMGYMLDEIIQKDVLKDYEKWGKYFNFVNKKTWIKDIFYSYYGFYD